MDKIRLYANSFEVKYALVLGHLQFDLGFLFCSYDENENMLWNSVTFNCVGNLLSYVIVAVPDKGKLI